MHFKKPTAHNYPSDLNNFQHTLAHWLKAVSIFWKLIQCLYWTEILSIDLDDTFYTNHGLLQPFFDFIGHYTIIRYLISSSRSREFIILFKLTHYFLAEITWEMPELIKYPLLAVLKSLHSCGIKLWNFQKQAHDWYHIIWFEGSMKNYQVNFVFQHSISTMQDPW